MLGDEPVDADEVILRRFNPDDDSHVVRDEGTGDYRLRSGAFYLRPDETGHSSHRRRVLDENQLSVDLVKNPPTYTGLAEARVEPIRCCEPSWEVRPDPWPTGYNPTHPEDVAHSLIVPTTLPKRTHVRRLARCFAVLSMT
jgi:hypothetical protein